MTEEELVTTAEEILPDHAAANFSNGEWKRLIALARVGLAVTPRPISASASGIDVIVFYDDGSADYIEADDNDYEFKPYEGPAYRGVARPTHFIPLSALPKPGGDA